MSRNRMESMIERAIRLLSRLLEIERLPAEFCDECFSNASTDGESLGFSMQWVIEQLASPCGSDWCSWTNVVAVVGHELGHVLYMQYGHRGSRWDREFYADYIAGWCLGRLGIWPTAEYIAFLSWQRASETHPAGPDRIAEMRYGHDVARGRARRYA